MKFVAILYDQAAVVTYGDTPLPSRTNATHYTGVAYIDKHPQPSDHPDMPALVQQFYGNLTAETVAQNFPRLMQSADVHAAVYDFGAKKAYLARAMAPVMAEQQVFQPYVPNPVSAMGGTSTAAASRGH